MRRSTLSFDAEEVQAEHSERQQGSRQSTPAAQHSLPEERKESEEESKTAVDADDDGDDALQRLARLRQERLRQRSGVGRRGRDLAAPAAGSSGVSSAAVSSVGSVRRGLRDIAVGDDFESARSSSVAADSSGAAGGYSREAMQQLRNNAIHISAAAAHGDTDTAAMQLEARDEEQEEEEEADASSQRSLIASAKMQRARRRAMAELGQDFIPIRREQTAPARISRRGEEGEDEDEGVTVQRLVLRNAIVLDGDEGEERLSEREAPAVHRSVRFGRVYVAGDESDVHGTLLREDETDDVVDVSNDSREVKDADRLLFGDDGREGRRLGTRKEIQSSLKQQQRQSAEEEIDSELEEWEEEQLRKGGVRLAVSKQADDSRRPQQRSSLPLPSLSAQHTLQSLSLSGLQSSLQSHLSSLRQTHAASLQQLASLSVRLSRKREEELQLHRAAEEAEEHLLFHREMRDWVETLLSMLGEKVADVDEAWEEMRRMRRRRGEDRRDRWRLYRRDEKDELQTELAGGVKQLTAAAEQQPEVQEVDEFGRDLSYVRELGKERRDDVKRRVRQLLQEQRKRSRTAAEAAGREEALLAASAGWDGEGWDSEEAECCEQEEGAASSFSSSLSSFLQDVGGILQDVEAEWRALPAVVGQLQHWRQRAPHSFHDAFIALALPRLLAPYTRIDCMLSQHELLPPLLSSPPAAYASPFTLSSFAWHRTLERYCIAAQAQASGGEEEDAHLIPKLLLSVLAPLLLDVLRFDWDVRSERQTRRMIQALQQLTAHIAAEGERGDRARQELEAAVSARLQEEVDDGVDVSVATQPVSDGYATQREAVRAAKLLWTLSLCEGVGEAAAVRSMLAVQRRRVEQQLLLMPHAPAVHTLLLAVLSRTQSGI